MNTMKQWYIKFQNLQSKMYETDYYYTLKEFMTALNKIAEDKDKVYISSNYNEFYKPRK